MIGDIVDMKNVNKDFFIKAACVILIFIILALFANLRFIVQTAGAVLVLWLIWRWLNGGKKKQASPQTK